MRVEEPVSLIVVGLMCVSLLLGMVGGIGTLAVLIDGQHSRSAALLGFSCFFALGGAVTQAYLSTFVAVRLSVPSELRIYFFTAGYILGGAAGFLFGRWLAGFYERAVRPRRRHRISLLEQLR
jgi:hypothetical protein